MMCLSQQCRQPRYVCMICQMQNHRDHFDSCYAIEDLEQRIKLKSDIYLQIETDLISRYELMKERVMQELNWF